MKKIIVFIIFVLVCTKVIESQEGWFILSQYQSSGGRITDMTFVNGETGYFTFQAGNGHYNYGAVNRTTNGGINWEQYEFGIPKYGICFINSNTGWLSGGYWDDANKRSREVFRTTNGGVNYIRLFVDSIDNQFQDIFFTDFLNGYLLTQTDLLKSTNSGINWTPCLTQHLYAMHFLNANTGWAVGFAGTVCRTTNGGLNWLSQTVGSGYLTDVFFINNITGWTCGGSVYVYRSTNGGINWTSYYTGQYRNYMIEFVDQNRGWVSGDTGKIVYTTNGGLNWSPQYSGVNHTFGLMCFPNALTGYVRGSKVISNFPYIIEDIFMKTTNGGITLVQTIGSEVPQKCFLSQNYPNPFNPSTKIKFEIALDSRLRGNDNVALKIYDALGREVTILVNEQLQPGTYEVEWDGSDFPSGVYFYKLIISDASTSLSISYTETKKMVLIK